VGGTYQSNIVDVTNYTTIGIHINASNIGALPYQLVRQWYMQDSISATPDAVQSSQEDLGFVNSTFNVKARYFSYQLDFTGTASITTLQVNSFLLISSGELYQLSNVGSGVEILKPQEAALRTVISSDASISLVQNVNEVDATVSSPFALSNVGGGVEVYIPAGDEMRTFVSADASVVIAQNAQTVDLAAVTDFPTNIGAGAEVYLPGTNELRTFVSADASVVIAQNAQTVDLAAVTDFPTNIGAGAQVYLPGTNELRSFSNTDGLISVSQSASEIVINSAAVGTANINSANCSFENYAAPTVVVIGAINTLEPIPTPFIIREVTAGSWVDAGSGALEYSVPLKADFYITVCVSGLAAGISGPALRFHLQTRAPPGAWANIYGASSQDVYNSNTRRSTSLTGYVRIDVGEQIRVGVINTTSTDNLSVYINSITILGPSF